MYNDMSQGGGLMTSERPTKSNEELEQELQQIFKRPGVQDAINLYQTAAAYYTNAAARESATFVTRTSSVTSD